MPNKEALDLFRKRKLVKQCADDIHTAVGLIGAGVDYLQSAREESDVFLTKQELDWIAEVEMEEKTWMAKLEIMEKELKNAII